MRQLTPAQLKELKLLKRGRQAASTARSRVQNNLGKMGLARLVEGVLCDYWEITDAGRTALLPHQPPEEDR